MCHAISKVVLKVSIVLETLKKEIDSNIDLLSKTEDFGDVRLLRNELKEQIDIFYKIRDVEISRIKRSKTEIEED